MVLVHVRTLGWEARLCILQSKSCCFSCRTLVFSKTRQVKDGRAKGECDVNKASSGRRTSVLSSTLWTWLHIKWDVVTWDEWIHPENSRTYRCKANFPRARLSRLPQIFKEFYNIQMKETTVRTIWVYLHHGLDTTGDFQKWTGEICTLKDT